MKLTGNRFTVFLSALLYASLSGLVNAAGKHLYPYLASLIVVSILVSIVFYITFNGSSILA